MFGFGFIMSLIFFSLRSADPAHSPHPTATEQAIKHEASGDQGLCHEETRDFLQHVPSVILCPALGEQEVRAPGTLTG